MANCYIRLDASNCVEALQRYCIDNKQITPRQLQICQWLIEYLEQDRLPETTAALFVHPLSQSDEYLLIKCIVLKSLHGEDELAYELALVLEGKDGKSDKNETVFDVVQRQMLNTDISSLRWMLYFEYTTFLLSKSGRYSYILTNYPSILENNKLS